MALSNSSSLLMTYGVLFFLFIAFGIDCIIYLFVYLFNVCIFCCYRMQTESWPKKEKKKLQVALGGDLGGSKIYFTLAGSEESNLSRSEPRAQAK